MGIVVRDKRFPSSTGICDVRYRVWAPDEPRACVQIIHGMAEHIERYHDFAMFLAENGILVWIFPDTANPSAKISLSATLAKRTDGIT